MKGKRKRQIFKQFSRGDGASVEILIHHCRRLPTGGYDLGVIVKCAAGYSASNASDLETRQPWVVMVGKPWASAEVSYRGVNGYRPRAAPVQGFAGWQARGSHDLPGQGNDDGKARLLAKRVGGMAAAGRVLYQSRITRSKPSHQSWPAVTACSVEISRSTDLATASSTTVPLKNSGLRAVCNWAALVKTNSRKPSGVINPCPTSS